MAATRAREQFGERYLQSLTVGVRVPLGGGDRSRAKELAARADALDAEVRASVERDRLTAEVAAASARVKATQAQREAMARHATLARDSMVQLNRIGADIAKLPGVHAMTDVTGFGLLGHLIEMCEGSGVNAELDSHAIPVLPLVQGPSAALLTKP